MASNTPDILLLFGIEGGGDITSGSGKLISDSLEEIVRKVETNITKQIKIDIDTNSINAAIDKIQSVLNSANFTVNVNGVTAGTQGASGVSSGGGTAKADSEASLLKSIQLDAKVDASLKARHKQLITKIQESLIKGEEELVRSLYTTDDNSRIIREAATIRNTKTKETYTRTYEPLAIRNSDGKITGYNFKSYELSSIVGDDAQVQRYLDGITNKLESIKSLRDSILKSKSEGNILGSDTAPEINAIDKTIGDIESKISSIKNGTSANVSQTQSEISGLLADANRQVSQFSSGAKEAVKQLASLDASRSKLTEYAQDLSRLDKNMYVNSNGDETQAYKALNDKLKETKSLFEAIDAAKNNNGSYDWASLEMKSVNSYESALKAVPEQLREIARLKKELTTNGGSYGDAYIESTIRSYYDTLQKAAKIEPNISNGKSYANDVRTYITELERAKSSQTELSQNGQTALNNLKQNFLGVVSEAKQLNTTYKELEISERRQKNAITQNNKIYSEATRYYKENESGIRRNITLNQQWQTLLKDTLSGKYLNNTQGLRTALSELQTQTKLAGAEVKTLWAQVKKLFTDHFGSISATAVIGTAVNTLRNVYEKVKDIDSAMTELKKVTELTESQYESFGKTAKRVADSVGGTISDTISAVADFSRLGYGIGDATKLAEAAIVYKNVGDGIEDIGTASQSIISTMKAFGIESDKAMFIVDKFNEVGNKFAIDSSGVGEALRRSAAALAAANNTLDESIALATAGNNVIQDPDVVGTALKTSSMFLRAAKVEAEEAGVETEGMATSVAKLRDELISLSGVDIMLNNDTFKSTFQVYGELADKWSQISDINQAAILEKLGGKRQANIIAAILTNFDEARKVLETAAGAEGSALAENDKYLESIEGHAQSLERSFEKLSMDFLDEEVVKTVLDVLKSIVETIDYLQSNGMIAALIGGGFASKLVKDFLQIKTVVTDSGTELQMFGKQFGQVFEKYSILDHGTEVTRGGIGDTLKNRVASIFGGRTTMAVDQDVMALQKYAEALKLVFDGKITLASLNQRELFGDGSLAKASASAQEFALSLTDALDDERLTTSKEKFDAISNSILQWGDNARDSAKELTVLGQIGKTLKANLVSIGIDLAIQGVVLLISSIVQEQQRQAEILREAAEEAREENNNVVEAYEKLQKIRQQATGDKSKNQELIDATNNLANALGMEQEKVDELKKSYDKYAEAVDKETVRVIKENIPSQLNAVVESQTKMFDEARKPTNFTDNNFAVDSKNTYGNIKTTIGEFLYEFANNNPTFATYRKSASQRNDTAFFSVYGNTMGQFTGNENQDVKGVLLYLDALRATRDALLATWGKYATDIPLYNSIIVEIKELQASYDDYVAKSTDYIRSIVTLDSIEEFNSDSYKNFDEYKKARDAFKNNILKRDDFVGTEEILDSVLFSLLPSYGNKEYESHYQLQQKVISKLPLGNITEGYVSTLSEEDMQIILQLDDSVLQKGLPAITKAIQDWKADPDNKLFDEEQISLSDIADDVAAKTKVISAAMGEMDDSGSVTTSTYNELIGLGDEYSECIEYQNGKIVVNIQKLKELAAQNYLNAAAAAKLQLHQMQLSYSIVDSADDYKRFIEKSEELNKIIAENTAAANEIMGVSGKSETKTDTKNTEFETLLDDLKDKYDRGLYDYEEYLKKRVALIDKYYPANSEDPEIAAQRKKLLNDVDWEALYDTRMAKWEKQNGYDPTDIKSIQERNKAAAALAKSMYFGTGSEHQSPTQYKEAISKIADSELEVLKDMYDRGLIMTDEYISSVNAVREKYTDENGEFIIPITFVTEAVDPEDVIKGKLKEWKDKYGYDEKDEDDKNNIELRRQYSEYYRKLVVDTYGNENSAWYNPAKLAEYHKEIDEYDLDIEETRQKQTLNYLNDVKSSIEERYNLEEEELDKINEREERRLNLIKARKDLEDARKNRNQLLFADGGYYYDYDQEAVQNAEEKYNNLLKEEAKAKKEEQKEADVSAIDALIDATEKLGDKDVSTLFTDIIEQAVGEYAKNPKSQSTMDVLSQIANGTFNPTTEELMSLIGTINPSGNLQGIIQTNAQDKTAAANNLYENSNITDNSVNIEAVNITVPAGTEAAMAQSLINDFASSVMDEINKLRAKEQ